MAACHPESSRISAASQSQLPRSEWDRQPIEDSNLSGSHVTSSSPGESEQRLKRIRRVVRGTARKADGIERSKDEVAQQASIRLRGQNACALCIPDELGRPGHIAAPQFCARRYLPNHWERARRTATVWLLNSCAALASSNRLRSGAGAHATRRWHRPDLRVDELDLRQE
jgi:hypothetical protein